MDRGAVFAPLSLLLLCCLACASVVPKAELDRCTLGPADGNDSLTIGQGTACRMVAARLVDDDRASDAIGYARRSCELQDARGCEQYIALVRGEALPPSDELARARLMGEKACAGIVLSVDGADPRPELCVHTAELYLDVEPRSPADAGRLYARACRLGNDRSCGRAKALGVSIAAPTATPPASAPVPAPPKPPPAASASAPVAACHEMRSCVTLDVRRRITTELEGLLTNRCEHAVTCTWCPSRSEQVDKSACKSATLAPGESRSGRESGLIYDGYNGIAYDCIDVNDAPGCLGM